MASEGHQQGSAQRRARSRAQGNGYGYGTYPPMPLSERAKIFVPFDPLKGFHEALRERERQARESVHDFSPLDDDTSGEGGELHDLGAERPFGQKIKR